MRERDRVVRLEENRGKSANCKGLRFVKEK